MGNAQSREAGASRRFQNRLSKPRTNLTITNTLKLPGTPSRRNSVACRPATDSCPSSLVVDIGVEDVSNIKEKPKFRRRISLFRSKHSQPKVRRVENTKNPETESLPSQSVGCSRCNSLTFELSADQQFYSHPNAQTRPPARSRMTLQHVPYAQNYSRLSLVPEARSLYPGPIRDDGKMLSDDDDNNNNIARQFGERTQSDLELYVPIRRRSLLQHGVATRNSFIENTSHQSLPSQIKHEDDMRDSYYNPPNPTSSPLSNLAVLTTGLETTQDMPRTETPDDLHYIGAFKLGTLRITNGAASPVPSDRVATPVDYVSSTPQDSAVILDVKSQPFSTSDSKKAPWTIRTESPLRQTYSELEANEQPPIQAPELLFTRPDSSDCPSVDFVREYVQDMPRSPFSFQDSPPLSPGLQTTSKHMAVEDDLFEIESGTAAERAQPPPRSVDSGFQDGISPHPNPALRRPKDLPPIPLTKADSGYSSNASIRSFRKEPQPSSSLSDQVGPPPPPKEKEPVSRARVPSSTYSIASASSRQTSSSRERPRLPHDAREPNSVAQQKPKVLVRTNNPRQLSLPSYADLVGEGTTPIDSPTSENGSSRWRGGWKQRSQSQPPQQVFTVQAMPSDGLFIPPVPADVSRKLEERVDRFPVTSFPNTFATTNAMNRTPSKETLGTIFSVGSAELREEPTHARLQSSLPAIPADAREGEAKATPYNHRHIHQAPAAAVNRPPNRQSLPILPIYQGTLPKLSRAQSQDQFEAQITSNDNISYSLGKSPYDVALPATPNTTGHRAKSLTSQLEGLAAARSATAQSVSQNREFALRKQRSSSTIAAQGTDPRRFDQNPNSSGSNKSIVPKKYPPQSHRAYSMNSESFSQNDTYRMSVNRIKSPPPVSMQTHRQSVSLLKSPQDSLSSRNPPPVPAPSRNPPPTPAYQAAEPEKGDPWAAQKIFWSSKKQEAEQDIRRKSIEAAAIRRPNSARPVSHRGRSPFQQPPLRTYASFEHTEYPYGTGQSGYSHNNYLDTRVGSYDLSYGSTNNNVSPANEYYEANSYQDTTEVHFPRTIHQRINSTSDMLVLDQFAGGLDYGYELGYELGGSVGTRNTNFASSIRKSVGASMQYGVDSSDMPVFLHGVKVEA
ncbi:hypothetical protein B7494_g2848 [Chlorociboria aeruginascens]|nr:hypothetical protein B7494_g2848 [Chlorociboria aeruginascens]